MVDRGHSTRLGGDRVVCEFPADLRTKNAFNGSAAIWRGPLVFTAIPLLRGEAIPEVGLTASFTGYGNGLESIVDDTRPLSSRGDGVQRFTFWNHTFDLLVCRHGVRSLPGARVMARASPREQPADARGTPPEYGVVTNSLNVVNFRPVETGSLRLEIQLQDDFSGGLLQLKRD